VQPSKEVLTPGRARLLRVVLSLALLCGLALSRRLWLSSSEPNASVGLSSSVELSSGWLSSGRLYPNVPAFDFLPRVSHPLDYLWLVALVALAAAVAFVKRPRVYAFALVALAFALAAFDESRLQPWFYQYLLMTLVLAAARSEDEGGAREALRACGLVVACVYFWGGAQKLNPQFFSEVSGSLAAPYVSLLPASFARLVAPLAVLVPLVEICAGLFLLTRRFRRAGVWLALLTHAVVLLLFVPFRRNNVIWPWNVAMAAFVLIIFRRSEDRLRDFLPRRALSVRSLAFVMFGLMPFLSLFGLWGQYLSAALYSGNTARAEVALSERVARALPQRVQSKLRPAPAGLLLDLSHWSYAELNVPAYPSERVYRRAAATLCAFAESPSDVRLSLTAQPPLFGGTPATIVLDCDRLAPR
jgi:hypothetical protein